VTNRSPPRICRVIHAHPRRVSRIPPCPEVAGNVGFWVAGTRKRSTTRRSRHRRAKVPPHERHAIGQHFAGENTGKAAAVLRSGVFAFTSFPSSLSPLQTFAAKVAPVASGNVAFNGGNLSGGWVWRKARCLSEQTRGIGIEFRQVPARTCKLASPRRNAFSAKMVR